ncbi:NXPE family member 1-like [Ambystoma mexicanum]|uniref:NXPE family member 1-like n=1 Tax=Ambystoma mexicanum TaxID=8296 RepID=UPI0037E95BD2
MLLVAVKGKKPIVALVIITCILLTYYSLQTYPFFSKVKHFSDFYRDSAVDQHKAKIPATETDLEIIEIFNEIDKTIHNAPINDLNHTTSAEKSQATILNPKDKYCTGDNLTVQIDVYDFSGNRKEHGGDFIRARIYSPEVKAGASGIILDLKNGSYYVTFTLFWEGKVRVSLLLIHPSEGVSALWRARNKGYKNVYWTGQFVNGTHGIYTECGLKFNTTQELCEYPNHCDGERFYCIKPERVPCYELKAMSSSIRAHSYLSDLEKSIFHMSNNGVEIKKKFEPIDVMNCNSTLTFGQEKCKTGMSSRFPSGYFYENLWRSLFCNVSYYENEELLNPCIQGKLIYLMGDSTLLQWIHHFPKFAKGLRYFDLHPNDWHGNRVALDMDRNFRIQWTKHGLPFLATNFPMSDYACITNQINHLAGDSYTAVVITLGQHLRPIPLEVFIRRVINIRQAVERLLRRAPQTKVIIKMGNTRELHPDVEHFSDFHGYVQYLATTRILQGLNVGVVDAWDMTIASASQLCHPPEYVVHNQINMFLSYIC